MVLPAKVEEDDENILDFNQELKEICSLTI